MPQLELPPDHVTTAAEAIEMRRHVRKMRVLGIRVKTQVASFTPKPEPPPPPPTIQNTLTKIANMMIGHVCAYYNVTRDDIMSNTRCDSNTNSYASMVTCARHVAIYFTRKVYRTNVADISKFFGRTDSNTLRSCRLVKTLLDTMPDHKISRGARAIDVQLREGGLS